MKRNLLILSFFFTASLIFLAMSFDEVSKTLSKNYVFSSFNEEPTLPATPYKYSGTKFPSHLTSAEDTIEIGYEAGHIDTTILDIVTDDGATLGRVLFYDKKLSALENLSCASCHSQEFSFTDNKKFSEGISSLTNRNSMALNDLGWTNRAGFFWNLSQTDLHTMIAIPLKDENEIGAEMDDVITKLSSETYYNDLFTNAYGDAEVTEFRIIDALVQYISSMTTFNSRFDEQAQKQFEDFTQAEIHGLELFSETCNHCHFEGGFQVFEPNFEFPLEELIHIFPNIFTNGLDEIATDPGVGDWLPGFNGLYKVPTLRNVEMTAPYMHDGRFETLEEVVDFYSEGVQPHVFNAIPSPGFDFSAEQKSNLIAFLKTLTDDVFLTDVKFSDPFDQSPNSIGDIPEIDLIVYPNPTLTTATIQVNNYTGDEYQVALHDQSGRLIKKDAFRSNEYVFDKNAFTSGTYYITITSENAKSIQKLIVQ